MSDRTLDDRFWSKVLKTDTCWLWQAGLTSNGYGQFNPKGAVRPFRAHRLSYEALVGPIPEGMQVDHKCRKRTCVNPDHLQLVSNQQNHENKSAHRNSKTGVRGVTRLPSGKYFVRATVNYVQHDGGCFATLEDAERAAITLRNRLMTNNLLDRVTPDPALSS